MAGDEAACREIVDLHSHGLHRLAFSLVGSAEDAEDVVQETFAGAFRALRDFEGRAALKTWLVRILVRQAARRQRTRARKRTQPLDSVADASGRAAAVRPPGETLDARLDVLWALDGLSPEHREVIVLREIEGMSYQEMADALDVARGTIESRLHRARQALRERLKDYLGLERSAEGGAPSDV
jgi:RNA polymerase sigma-70 factor (ECF subfamily)